MARSIILAVALVLAAAPPAGAQDTPTERGRDLVLRNCGMCHAVGVVDQSQNPAAPPLRALGRRYPVDSLGEALAEGIITGHRDMPEFVFDPDDVASIIRCLESIQTQTGAARAPARPPS